MRQTRSEIDCLVERVPDVQQLRDDLAHNIEERVLIRTLLRLAEQKQRLAARREVADA